MRFKKIALLLFVMILCLGLSNKYVKANATSTITGATATTSTTETSATTKSAISESTTIVKVVSSAKTKTVKTSKKYSSSKLKLMASIIMCEAGSESYQGKLAVGIVIMNRVKSHAFPNSITGVVYQRGQFSPVRNGALKRRLSQYASGRTSSKQWKDCISAAKKVLDGRRYIIYHGKEKSMKSFHFFSVSLPGARFHLGGHRFK